MSQLASERMPWTVLAGLILCNLIWSAHPLMSKQLLADVPPMLAAWLRYGSALVAYLVYVASRRHRAQDPAFFVPRTRRDLALVTGVGFAAFCFAPALQMTGLTASRATDNSLIVALEPLMTVLLAWAFAGQRLARAHFVAFGIALAGFALLASPQPSSLPGSHLTGNLLLLLSLTGEASYSVLSLKLLDRFPALGIFGSALALGVGILTIVTALIAGPGVFPQVVHLSLKSWLALLWLGPLGSGLAYFYWMRVLSQAPVASLALTLFVQPVFGSLWGYMLLGDRLSSVQLCGAALIVVALLTQSMLARS